MLDLDDSEEHMFHHGATGYGVEVYGGTPNQREAVFRKQFDEPIVVVDGRKADSSEDIVKAALLEMGTDKEDIEKTYSIGGIELRRALDETKSNFVILEFDSLAKDVQTSVAQMMKGVAEQLSSDDVMLGYACNEGGAVVNAEFDLSARVRSWELE